MDDSKATIKYAHLADLHLGSWRDSSLRDLSTGAFDLAIQRCIGKKYDFVLFAGDIFNTSLPAIDIVNHVAAKLQELKSSGIPLYVIPGSHDFSPTGRSMIDVLESAGLLINVCKGQVNPDTKQLELKYTIDPKTKAKITGILGRRGMLDRSYYENLARIELEEEQGYKIFMFHTTLTELKPKHLEMLESHAASFLPKKQHYYAGGHIHHKSLIDIKEYGPMTYTGPLFPNNFSELEKYSHGGYYEMLVQRTEYTNSTTHLTKQTEFKQTINWLPLKVKEHIAMKINCTGLTAEKIQQKFKQKLDQQEIKDTIITLRIEGDIAELQIKDLEIDRCREIAEKRGAYAILINSNKIQQAKFEGISLALEANSEEIEHALIKEHLSQQRENNNNDNNNSNHSVSLNQQIELQLIQDLLKAMHTEKHEGEKSYDFQERVIENCKVLFVKQEHQSTNKELN